MPTARTKLNLQKTLLILLGIILAVLLTFNAGSFNIAESIKSTKMIEKELPTPPITPNKTGMILLQNFTKKLSSLK